MDKILKLALTNSLVKHQGTSLPLPYSLYQNKFQVTHRWGKHQKQNKVKQNYQFGLLIIWKVL